MPLFPKKILGIDVGVAAIKMVEISQWAGTYRLENYGEIQMDLLPAKLLPPHEKTALPPRNFVATALKAVMQAAKIETRRAVFALPDFATFCASFSMPPMPEKEIPEAIRYHAPKYLASPVSEVTLDWTVVPGSKKNLHIFLTAVPNQLIADYRFIAEQAGLDLYAVESEALGTLRVVSALKPGEAVCIIDIGRQSATFSFADQGFLRKSYSLNFSGQAFRQAFSPGPENAPALPPPREPQAAPVAAGAVIPAAAKPMADTLVKEAKGIFTEILPAGLIRPLQVYLVGGFSRLPGLREYLSESLRAPVSLPNCFSSLRYPPKLAPFLEDISSRFAASVGVALDALPS